MKKYRSITGRIADWWAKVKWDNNAVEQLPCAHQMFALREDGRMFYHDPLNWGEKGKDGANALQEPKFARWCEDVRKVGRVILTTDIILESGALKRTGYVAVYDVANLTVDETGLKFDFTCRYVQARM
jgi:hypothetical protein